MHRQELAASDLVRRHRLPATTPERTAVDCLGLLPQDQALSLWAWLITRQIMSVDQLAGAVRQRYGQRGNSGLAQLLSVVRSGAASVAELKLHRLLRSAGIKGWTPNATIHDDVGGLAVVDILFPEARVIVEVDGYATHGGPEQFTADRRRQNWLVAAGYSVLRVTWWDLTERPANVLDEIRTVLNRHSRRRDRS